MTIEVAKRAGFCFGVKRAVKMAFEAARTSPGPVYTLGPIIHNPQVVDELERRGVKAVDRPSQIRSGTAIIRSHGVHPRVLAALRKKRVRIIDATCPFVTKAQRAASCLRDEGRQVAIVGEREHPEVVALKGYAGDNSMIFTRRMAGRVKPRLGVLAQTTLSNDDFTKALGVLAERASDIHVINTICQATQIRQRDTMALAERSDVMVVVGGKNSANTTRLVELCRKVGKPAYHVETEADIDPRWFKEAERIGITAGASTPEGTVRQVVRRIQGLATKVESTKSKAQKGPGRKATG
jgi:small subunit ribosomal protein S1